MKHIKIFNKISDIIHSHLHKTSYTISDDAKNYEAALVRSANLHDTAFPSNLLAIARAGAGVNNIPLDKCRARQVSLYSTPLELTPTPSESLFYALCCCRGVIFWAG